MIRIPASRGISTRVEVRSVDPSANPYLALSVLLAAGLDGIKNKLDAPAPIDRNIYVMDKEERLENGIADLPATLAEALGTQVKRSHDQRTRRPLIRALHRIKRNRMGYVPHPSTPMGTRSVYVSVLIKKTPWSHWLQGVF